MKKLMIYMCFLIGLMLSISITANAQTTQKKGISKQGKGAIIGGQAVQLRVALLRIVRAAL